jgi:hypothetical protein
VGLLTIHGALGARDVLAVWPERKETFDGFHGQDTLLARTVLRWERYGRVVIAAPLAHSRLTTGAIVGYRLDPDLPASVPRVAGKRCFRIVGSETALEPGEKIVERVGDAWGRPWGRVLGRRDCALR